MYAINSFAEILDELGRGFEQRYRHHANITGLVFARPQSALAQSEIIPHIEYWFHRSDYYTDFFLGGYAVNASADVPDGQPVKVMPSTEWLFSPRLFNDFVSEIENRTCWTYSGGTDFILATARYDTASRTASLDFSSAVAIDLELAKREDSILSVPHLFEAVFKFAKRLNEGTTDPAFAFSDQMGAETMKGGFKEALLALLPESLRAKARSAFHFISKDLEK